MSEEHWKDFATRVGWDLATTQERIAALEAEIARLRPDAALGQTLEGIIAMRTSFDGGPPYVGNDGVIQALNEALDERDKLRAALATARNDALEEAEIIFGTAAEWDWCGAEVSEAIRALKSPEKE